MIKGIYLNTLFGIDFNLIRFRVRVSKKYSILVITIPVQLYTVLRISIFWRKLFGLDHMFVFVEVIKCSSNIFPANSIIIYKRVKSNPIPTRLLFYVVIISCSSNYVYI